MRYEFLTRSPEETVALGTLVGQRLRGGDIVAYKGDLGAGKTTMTRGLSLGLGLGDQVTSPTFALVNEYRKKDSTLSLVHFDMYRITSDDLETTGFYDYLEQDQVLAVEWSENITDALEEGTVTLTITLRRLDEDSRLITLETENGDDRFEDIRDRYQR